MLGAEAYGIAEMLKRLVEADAGPFVSGERGWAGRNFREPGRTPSPPEPGKPGGETQDDQGDGGGDQDLAKIDDPDGVENRVKILERGSVGAGRASAWTGWFRCRADGQRRAGGCGGCGGAVGFHRGWGAEWGGVSRGARRSRVSKNFARAEA